MGETPMFLHCYKTIHISYSSTNNAFPSFILSEEVRIRVFVLEQTLLWS